MRFARPALTALVVALLAACGSGDNGPSTGALIGSPTTVGTLPKAALSAPCDVKVVGLEYTTPAVRAGVNSNASAGLLVPEGTDAACRGPFPLIAYARGTEVDKRRTMASTSDAEMLGMAKVFASWGYVVVATDYLGFAKSAHPYHPYLHSDSEATAVVDSIRAARAYAQTAIIPLSGKVMLYGYSQGGHSSLATQKAIETSPSLRSEIQIAAAGHGAAPSALGTSLRSGAEIAGGQYFVPFLITAWQKVYGDVYTSPAQVFKAPYSGYIEDLLPAPADTYTTLVTSGKLPASDYSAAMFQPTFVPSLQDGSSGVIRAALRNDLVASGWTPSSQTRFCAGSGDPTVPYATAQKLALDKWGTLANVSSRDVDPEVQAAAAAQGLTQLQLLGSYHGALAPAVCLTDMRAYFDARR